MKNRLIHIIIIVLAVALLLTVDFNASQSKNQDAIAATSVGYVTVPAAAFMPIDDTVTYYQGGSELYLTIPTAGGWFSAPVYLPNGAALNKLTYYWFDDFDGYDSSCQLMAADTGGTSWTNVAISETISSQGSSGDGKSETTNFPVATIDNSRYLYYMDCLLYRENVTPYSVTKLNGVRIEYTYPVYAPMVIK